jgi:signal recognition particle GTPase
MLAAADTFRAGMRSSLGEWAKRGCCHGATSRRRRSRAVVFDRDRFLNGKTRSAFVRTRDCYNKANLMSELGKIR